ncbi:MAG: MJ1477/TM1410 family putative glycoside hydrolase [Candidatus Anammoxibacter sp.]
MAIKRITFITIALLSFLHGQVKLHNIFAQDVVSINEVIDWGYQLQGYIPDLASIKDSEFDLIVMDYSFSGGPEDEFSIDTIEGLKLGGPCDRKIILAYMSIGEAEEFRFYFNDIPNDLLFEEPNPNFPDNIKVRFWESNWQKIIFGNQSNDADKSYLDRIIDAGFDGVYLDIIDAYEFWGPKEIGGNGERETAAKDMVDFLVRIADYARNTRGKTNFIIVPQNGAGIIATSSYPFADDPESEANTQKQRYFTAIDAIAAEDTFYFGDRINNNPLNIQNEIIELLNMFRDGGKNVLAVDYVQSDEKVDTFYTLSQEEGYIPYATIRDLDALTINNMHEPVCNDTLLNDDIPTPFASPTVTTTPSPLPTQTPVQEEGKNFTLKCENDRVRKFGGIEVMSLKTGEIINCTLVANNDGIKVSTELRTGDKVSITVDPVDGITESNGELEITLTAIDKGIDWISWAIPDKDGNLKFDKKAYKNGNAWGMFVIVR